MKTEKWIKELEKRRAAIGKERNKLRELIKEAEGLEECSIRAFDAVNEAIDALSELV